MQGKHAVDLFEVGPRDGFQYESIPIPTELKLSIIGGLIDSGSLQIQVTSFVHPDRVPQMADAEQIVSSLPTAPGVRFSGLCLNLKGVQRAAQTGLRAIDLSIATNETHGRDNVAMSVEEGVVEAIRMIEEAGHLGMSVQLGLQTVFGYAEPGDTSLDEVVLLTERFSQMGVESVSLADTTGMANPKMIRERLTAVKTVAGNTPIVLHLHDTRGLGLANIMAAWDVGISRFDTSLGGLGGCPFIAGAAGNVATEDVAYLFESMGVSTGIDIAGVAACSRRMSEHLGRELTGKVYRIA